MPLNYQKDVSIKREILKKEGYLPEFEWSENVIASIFIPWTDKEWVNTLNGDDNSWLPKCCSDISDMRDFLFQSLRDGKDMFVLWLDKFGLLAEAHGLTEEKPAYNIYPPARDSASPIARLL